MNFKSGDVLIHKGRPEWGIGTVLSAAPALAEGKPCQRLTVKFSREGSKTLSTAYADLATAEHQPTLAGSNGGWLGEAEAGDLLEQMTKLPEIARDPFKSPTGRFEATLSLYRFESTGSSLLDWAAVQSGLTDPLERFTRHELEEYHRRFRQGLDAHLKDLARSVRKSDPTTAEKLIAESPPEARAVLLGRHARR